MNHAQAGAAADAEALAQLITEQREEWSAGRRVTVEDYLAEHPSLAQNEELLLDLIYNEFCLREELTADHSPQALLDRFPQLADKLRPLLELHRALGQPPTLAADSATCVYPTPPVAVAACEKCGQTADQGSVGAACSSCGGSIQPIGAHVGNGLPVTPGGERFTIVKHHATGGLGEVFVARDVELGREVALKRIRDSHADKADSRARFLLEAEITGGLEHPGIVPVYGLGRTPEGRPYYAMRFIRGDTLEATIAKFYQAEDDKAADRGRQAVEFRKLLGRFLEVCNAIEYAHSRGVLHRDIKPANVMLGKYGETLVVDWGLAKTVGRDETVTDDAEATLVPLSAGNSSRTQMGSAVGTPSFMSPEQAAGRLDELRATSDVYSLGATLYCLITGHSPFVGRKIKDTLDAVQRGEFPPPREARPTAPAGLEAIVLKAMAREPAARYASAAALARDVENWLADEPISARTDNLSARIGRWQRRHRAAALAGATALAVVAIVATASTILINEQKHVAQELAGEKSLLATQEKEARKKAERLATEKATLAAKEQAAHAEAKKQTGLAEEATKKEQARAAEAKRLAGELMFDQALAALDQNSHGAGVLTLAKALALAPADDRPMQHVLRSSIAQWEREMPGLTAMYSHAGQLRTAAFDSTGRLAATGGADKQVMFWDVASGKLQQQLTAPAVVQALAFAPSDGPLDQQSGQQLVVADDTGFTVWKNEAGKFVKRQRIPAESVQFLEFSRDGKVLLTGSLKTLQVWQFPELTTIPLDTSGALGQRIAPPLATRGIPRASNTTNPEPKRSTNAAPDGTPAFTPVAESAVVLSPDGKHVAAAGVDPNTAVIWSIETGKVLHSALSHSSAVVVLTFSPDSGTLAIGAKDGHVALWDVGSGSPRFGHVQVGGELREIAFSPDSRHFATASRDMTARIWSAANGTPASSPLLHEGSVECLTFSADGQRLLTGSFDHTAREWDVATGRPLGRAMQHGDALWAVRYSADGRHILTGSFETFARQWRASRDDGLPPIRHSEPLQSLALSADGQTLLTLSGDGVARIWNAATGQVLGDFGGGSADVSTAAIDPAGKFVAAAVADVVELRGPLGQQVGVPLVHAARVVALAFSRDGRVLVTATNDRQLHAWHVDSHRRIASIDTLVADIERLTFAAAGDNLVVQNATGEVQRWAVPSELPPMTGDARTQAGVPLARPVESRRNFVRLAVQQRPVRIIPTAGPARSAEKQIPDDAPAKRSGTPPAPTGDQKPPTVVKPALPKSESPVKAGTLPKTSSSVPGNTGVKPKTSGPSLGGTGINPNAGAKSPRGGSSTRPGTGGNPIPNSKPSSSAPASSGTRSGIPRANPPVTQGFRSDNQAPTPGNSVPASQGTKPSIELPVPLPPANVRADDGTKSAEDKTKTGDEEVQKNPTIDTVTADEKSPAVKDVRETSAADQPNPESSAGPQADAKSDSAADVRLRMENGLVTAKTEPAEWDRRPHQFAVSHDGQVVALGRENGYAEVSFPHRKDAAPHQLAHRDRVWCVAVSPDGATVFTGAGYGPENRGQARLWNAADGKPRGLPLERSELVRVAAFSADGRYLITGSSTGGVGIYDVTTGRPLGPKLRHGAGIAAISIAQSGTSVAVADTSGLIRVLTLPKPIETPPAQLARRLERDLGLTLDAGGAPVQLDADQWRERDAELRGKTEVGVNTSK